MTAATNLTNLYIYLARLDKKGVQILAILQSRPVAPVRLGDVSTLSLPAAFADKISQAIYDNRMLWEPWVETADDYASLRTSLTTRGYSNLPVSGQPEFPLVQAPVVNASSLPQVKTMLRKASG